MKHSSLSTFLSEKTLIKITLLLFLNSGMLSAQLVHLYSNQSIHCNEIKQELDKANIRFEEVDSLKPNDETLYVLFDAFSLNEQQLPKNYIVYQTLDLQMHGITNAYVKTLSNAIAVWDCNQKNIDMYKSHVHHYFYFPPHYEFADPILLVCSLPHETLPTYKEILIYSNTVDTDISSHLPTLFCHTMFAQPKLLLDVGVRSGEATRAFEKAALFCNTQLIGIDIDARAKDAYKHVKNGIFVLMNDREFDQYYHKAPFNGQKLDLVFIDTSHRYEHTLREIELFAPLLSDSGMLLFHDSNVVPLNNYTDFRRLNGTIGTGGPNPHGVAPAIKDYFNFPFDRASYINTTFTKDGTQWHFIHYPFCNGLTIVKKCSTK